MNLTIRWESALAIQHALARQGVSAADEAKAVAGLSDKHYVIALLGFRMPGQRAGSFDSDDDSADNSPAQRRNSSDRNASSDRVRSELLDAAQLAPKGKSSVYAEDVQFADDGSGVIRFLFPRSALILASDKEVDFILNVRRIKIEHRFKLADMQYLGKLAL